MLHIYSEEKFKKTGIILAIEISLALVLAFFIIHIMPLFGLGFMPIPLLVMWFILFLGILVIYGTIMHLIRIHFHRPQDNREEILSQRFFCVLSGGIITAILLYVLFIFLLGFMFVASTVEQAKYITIENKNYVVQTSNYLTHISEKAEYYEVINPIVRKSEPTEEVLEKEMYTGEIQDYSIYYPSSLDVEVDGGKIINFKIGDTRYDMSLDDMNDDIIGTIVRIECEFYPGTRYREITNITEINSSSE